MRWWTFVCFVTLLCTSCSSRDVREPWYRRMNMDWNIQRHLFESGDAWEQATGRNYEYDARDR
jgi:hypothetical protein